MRPRPIRALAGILSGLALAATLSSAHADDEPSIARIEELVEAGSGPQTAALREQVWNTPLGLLVHDYLHQGNDPARVSQRARQITNRIYASAQLTSARLTGLQIMLHDMYERGVVDQRIQLRIDQLQTEINMKGHVIRQSSSNYALKLVIPIVALGVLSGSPIVREQTGAALETAFIRLGLERQLEPAHRLRAFDPGFIKALRDEFSANYSYVRMGKTILDSGLSVAAFDYMFLNGANEDSQLEEQLINYFREAHAGLEEL